MERSSQLPIGTPVTLQPSLHGGPPAVQGSTSLETDATPFGRLLRLNVPKLLAAKRGETFSETAYRATLQDTEVSR